MKITDLFEQIFGQDGLDHAVSRYHGVSQGLIEKCQQDYLASRDLTRSIGYLDATSVAVIAAQSLEADQLLEVPLDTLINHPLEGLSDWSLAVLAQILFDAVRQTPDLPGPIRQPLQERAWTALELALDSPTVSPTLWYEDMFFDVAQEYRMRGDPHAVALMKRGLAHNLRHAEGDNTAGFLRDLAETYLWTGDLDRGLALYTALLRNDPSDIWTYNCIALTFDHFGLADIGIEGARRGLALIDARGDQEDLRQQLLRACQELKEAETRGRESEVDPSVLADLRAALATDFDAGIGLPGPELARQLIPDLDTVPVKRLPEAPDLPPRNQTVFRKSQAESEPRIEPTPPLATLPERSKKPRLGRNDPCWCGSGKKYKRCHWRLDISSADSQVEDSNAGTIS